MKIITPPTAPRKAPRSKKPKYRFYAYENQNREIVVNTNLLVEKIELYSLDIVKALTPKILGRVPEVASRHIRYYNELRDPSCSLTARQYFKYVPQDGCSWQWAEISFFLFNEVFDFWTTFGDASADRSNREDFELILQDFTAAQEYTLKTEGYAPTIRTTI